MKQHTDSNFNFLLVGADTHVGQIRKANEDSMAIFEVANMKVFVVCDGMGGHVGGQVASQTAINAIRDFLFNNITLDPREAIHNSIIAANEAILNKTRQQPELSGMGSTCVMLVVTSDGKAYYGHVGDSRIYIIANHHITQLTKDHSFVQSLVDAEQITKEQAEHHPRKNEITNALGLPAMQPPTVCHAQIEAEAGNCFLLCSDGLTGMVGDEQIQRLISKHEIPIQQRTKTLVKMANQAGGVDNITVELVEFAVGTQQIGSSKSIKMKSWKKMLLLALPVVLLLAGGTAWWFLKEKKVKEDVSEIVILNDEKEKDMKEITFTDTATYKLDIKDLLPENSNVEIVSIDFPEIIFIRYLGDTILYVSKYPQKFKNIIFENKTRIKTEDGIGIVGEVNIDRNISIAWVNGSLPEKKVTIYVDAKRAKKPVVCKISFLLKEKKSEKEIDNSTEKTGERQKDSLNNGETKKDIQINEEP